MMDAGTRKSVFSFVSTGTYALCIPFLSEVDISDNDLIKVICSAAGTWALVLPFPGFTVIGIPVWFFCDQFNS